MGILQRGFQLLSKLAGYEHNRVVLPALYVATTFYNAIFIILHGTCRFDLVRVEETTINVCFSTFSMNKKMVFLHGILFVFSIVNYGIYQFLQQFDSKYTNYQVPENQNEQPNDPSLGTNVYDRSCVSGGLRMCDICDQLKPPNVHHCSRCGYCVEDMDHHCPWVSNCITSNNRSMYIQCMIQTSFVFAITSRLCIAQHLPMYATHTMVSHVPLISIYWKCILILWNVFWTLVYVISLPFCTIMAAQQIVRFYKGNYIDSLKQKNKHPVYHQQQKKKHSKHPKQ